MVDFLDADFGALGNAADSLFTGIGASQAAGSYKKSAKALRQNAKLEEESFNIKRAMLDRQIYGAIGGQKADVAAAGFKASGSGLDLIRDSAAQGALAKAALGLQKDIAVKNWKDQASAASDSAAAESTAAVGGFFGTALNIAAFALPFLFPSDRRLKTRITMIGLALNGLPWYSFRYLGSDAEQQGLMSDDVRAFRPEAVAEIGGFDRVNYALALA